jgi:GNAT superfamily N-acetyltransferase
VSVLADLEVKTYRELPGHQRTELRLLWHHATRSDSHSIGWLPTRAFDTRSENNEVIACYRNADLVGWSMAAVSKSRAVLKLYQIWVRPDARILEHGRSLVAKLRGRAWREHCYQIEAWVAEDLPANIFWAAIGFQRNNWRWGKGLNTRRQWRWTTLSASVCDAEPKSGCE